MDIPSSWWPSAEKKVSNIGEVREHLDQVLKNHPEPQTLISYLNERRFILLLEILDQCSCLRTFLIRHPEDFQKTIPGLWYKFKEKEDYLKELSNLVSDSDSDREFSTKLTYFKLKELLRLFSKDILKTAKLEDILREYSFLADAIIEIAYQRAIREYEDLHGIPLDYAGNPVTGAVIALGKLGSEELNYFSDIDLIFIHSEDKAKTKSKTGAEFFSDVFRKTVKLISSETTEGSAFKVDLDLRPFGKTGPITMSLRSAELYYESYGRIWERFALLRSRPVAGDMNLGRKFIREVVVPFVYSSADYKLVAEIKSMKKRIEAEAKKKLQKGFNVKTGDGGIREIEFTIHAISILAGSKNKFLREKNTFRAIWKLCQRGIFSNDEAVFLEHAYAFLRNLEHKIQLKNCTQTHTLREEDVGQIARWMGYEKEQDFRDSLEEVRCGIREIFDSLIPEKKEEEPDTLQVALITDDSELGQHALKSKGIEEPAKVFHLLQSYVSGKEGINMSDRDREKFIELAPQIVDFASKTHDPYQSLKNFEKFFANPTGKKVILSDPKEDFLEKLFNVFSLSETLSSLISKNPDLVEDVLTLYQEYPFPEDFKNEFEKYRQILHLSFDNLIRRFKKVWEIRIGLVYLMREKDIKNLKDLYRSLTDLADFLMNEICKEFKLNENMVVMYSLGKLGSRELTFRSDLDLVFCTFAQDKEKQKIYDSVRKAIRSITSHTVEGYLYDLDFRLRPMGSKGELVPNIEFYKEYFSKEARTWERLAWTRARSIAGDSELLDEFEYLIQRFLFDGEWGEKERREVLEMRLKLENHSKKGKGMIDIKFGKGGTFDGEFVVQYLLIKEKIRERSMIKGLEILSTLYPLLRSAIEPFMFLRMVETHLRLLRESGGSVIKANDKGPIAKSFNMEVDEFEYELDKSMKRLREIMLEYLD